MDLQMLQEEFDEQEKHQLNGGAKRARVRRMAEDERLIDTIPAFRVNEDVSKVVRGIVKKDRRSISDVARALLERGVAAYQRDGELFEPEGVSPSAELPAEVPVTTITLGEEGGSKKKRA
jgi:hypothetical protein